MASPPTFIVHDFFIFNLFFGCFDIIKEIFFSIRCINCFFYFSFVLRIFVSFIKIDSFV